MSLKTNWYLFPACTAILLAILYSRCDWSFYSSTVSQGPAVLEVQDAWDRLITEPNRPFNQVSFGLNANLDVIVNGTELLRAVGVSPSETPMDHTSLCSISSLEQTFTYFMAQGAAAERIFDDRADFDLLMEATNELPGKQAFIGGNAALMAHTVASTFPDCQVRLFGPVGPSLAPLLHPSVIVPETSRVDEDEIHLILEYSKADRNSSQSDEAQPDNSQLDGHSDAAQTNRGQSNSQTPGADQSAKPRPATDQSNAAEEVITYQWGLTKAPRANRFIASQDLHNSHMAGLSALLTHHYGSHGSRSRGSRSHSSEPKANDGTRTAIILTGFHLIEGRPEEFRSAVLAQLGDWLRALPLETAVHVELASMTSPVFMKDLFMQVCRYAPSLGLNEQELGFLAKSLDLQSASENGHHTNTDSNHSNVKAVDDSSSVTAVTRLMEVLLKKYGRRSAGDSEGRRLTRVHVHSLAYHIAVSVGGSWLNQRSAVAAGTRMALRRACQHKGVDADGRVPHGEVEFAGGKPRRVTNRPFDSSRPVIGWEKDGLEFAVGHALVCKDPEKTVGLGDTISATALMYSQYRSDLSS